MVPAGVANSISEVAVVFMALLEDEWDESSDLGLVAVVAVELPLLGPKLELPTTFCFGGKRHDL
jgi:hypothetical protein